jgi:hypothetical protein
VEQPDGYHWFRLDDDGGTTFIALREEGLWYVPGVEEPVDPSSGAVYLRPVEPAPHN